MTEAPAPPDAAAAPNEPGTPKPPALLGVIRNHPGYVLLALTLWSLLISLYYVRGYLEVFGAEPAWFSIDPLQLAVAAFPAYANTFFVLFFCAILVPHIRIGRPLWLLAYALLVLSVWTLFWNPLFSLGALPWNRAPFAVLGALFGLGVLVIVPMLHRGLGKMHGGRTRQTWLLTIATEEDTEARWLTFGSVTMSLLAAAAIAVAVGQNAGWSEARQMQRTLLATHEQHVEFLRSEAGARYDGIPPNPAAEHIVFSDGGRELVAQMTEGAVWIAVREGDTVIDPCVVILKHPEPVSD